MSRVEALFHIVFATKNRGRTLAADHRRDLYAYIYGLLQRKGCHVYRIGGVEDHVHILLDLNPSVALADLVRDVKRSTSTWAKESGHFPDFTGWESEYAAFSCAKADKDSIIEYIKGQEEHHKTHGFEEWAAWWNRIK